MNPARAVRLGARIGWVLFALTLHTATHWPQLSLVEAPFSWFDKVVHACSYFIWTVLLALTGWLGHPASGRTLLKCMVLGLIVGALDEVTQGLPMVRRDPSVGDFLADASGVMAAGAALFVARSWLAQLDTPMGPNRK